MLGPLYEHPRIPPQHHPPEPPPSFVVVIDQQHRVGVGPNVSNPAQGDGPLLLWLAVDRVIDRGPDQDEADRHHRRARSVGGREMPDPGMGNLSSHGGVDRVDADIIL